MGINKICEEILVLSRCVSAYFALGDIDIPSIDTDLLNILKGVRDSKAYKSTSSISPYIKDLNRVLGKVSKFLRGLFIGRSVLEGSTDKAERGESGIFGGVGLEFLDKKVPKSVAIYIDVDGTGKGTLSIDAEADISTRIMRANFTCVDGKPGDIGFRALKWIVDHSREGSRAKWKPGDRIVVNIDGKIYMGTVTKFLNMQAHITLDNGSKVKMYGLSKDIIGRGIDKRLEAPLPVQFIDRWTTEIFNRPTVKEIKKNIEIPDFDSQLEEIYNDIVTEEPEESEEEERPPWEEIELKPISKLTINKFREVQDDVIDIIRSLLYPYSGGSENITKNIKVTNTDLRCTIEAMAGKYNIYILTKISRVVKEGDSGITVVSNVNNKRRIDESLNNTLKWIKNDLTRKVSK